MEERTELQVIARMKSEFSEKFGIPRQSGLVAELKSTLVFEPAFRNPDVLRGIEDFSHLWLIWGFHRAKKEHWSATVRPPRLGGNERLGVFATRSPFRPNPLGLSCVKLEGVEWDTPQGAVLRLSGADLLDGTPIYDIKPYIPYADCQPTASEGYAHRPDGLRVILPDDLGGDLTERQREALRGVLACDPRPHYQDDPTRVYGMSFAGAEVKFTVAGDTLTVTEISR